MQALAGSGRFVAPGPSAGGTPTDRETVRAVLFLCIDAVLRVPLESASAMWVHVACWARFELRFPVFTLPSCSGKQHFAAALTSRFGIQMILFSPVVVCCVLLSLRTQIRAMHAVNEAQRREIARLERLVRMREAELKVRLVLLLSVRLVCFVSQFLAWISGVEPLNSSVFSLSWMAGGCLRCVAWLLALLLG